MELQDYLLTHPNWEKELAQPPYNLKITRDDGYVMFKYNQISSDFSIPLVREARGIVFRESDWTCVCHAFDKFGNWGEDYVQPLDWDNGVSIQEKIDGSLMKLWWDKSWHLSTNGTIDARKAMCGDITYYDLFEKALKAYGFNSLEQFTIFNTLPLDVGQTYMFELATRENRIVIPYKGYHIYLLSIRDSEGHEWSTHELEFGIDYPKTYHLNTLEDVIAAANELPWNEEGYVCVDSHFNRVKVKSPSYVEAHYSRNNGVITIKRLVEVILTGEEKEFLVYCGDYQEKIDEIKKKQQELKDECLRVGKKFANSANKKELSALLQPYSPLVRNFSFCYYDNNALTFEEFTKDWNANKWVKALESETKE